MKKVIIECKVEITKEVYDKLVDGPKIKYQEWFKVLPIEVFNLISRLSEMQQRKRS